MEDDFGGRPNQTRPAGGYWIPREFHAWPEIRMLRLAELGAFVETGIQAVNYGAGDFGREMFRFRSKRLDVDALVAGGLWYPTGPKTWRTKTMGELRCGRGNRGQVVRLSRRLYVSPETCRAGVAAFGLYALAASWSLTTGRPGYIPTDMALHLGKPRHISALWDSGLWLVREYGFCMSKGDGFEARWDLYRDDTRAPIPEAVRLRVFARSGNRCVRCGTTEELALDHIYPWSLGGPDDEDNLQALCTPCNSTKGAKVLEKGGAW